MQGINIGSKRLIVMLIRLKIKCPKKVSVKGGFRLLFAVICIITCLKFNSSNGILTAHSY